MTQDELVLLDSQGGNLTFSGTFPANPYRGQMGIVGGVRYLYRDVVELNGSDTLSFAPVASDLIGATKWETCFYFSDLAASVSPAGKIIILKAGSTNALNVSLQATGKATLTITNGLTQIRTVATVNIIPYNKFIRLKVGWDGTKLYAEINGEVIQITDFTGWTTNTGVNNVEISDDTSAFRPLHVCCIKQYSDFVLIDWIKCDEQTGAILANTINALRPATLSKASAHALAPVPID